MTSLPRTTSVKLDELTRAGLESLSVARNRSTHWLMREAIQEYVCREEKREALRQEALKVLSDYETTGLHVTAAEADAWMAQLEAGNDVEPPICHA
ncbi:MAG: ribbon-helix-helix domain-containing protein [Pseudomonadota bacterium]